MDSQADSSVTEPTPVARAVYGILTGLAIYATVLIALTQFDWLVVPPARSEGKGGQIVEALWMLMAWLPCAFIGALWAVHIGPKLDKRTPNDENA